ncbi:MAG TPA: FG-GAP-like repeat-containing protein [Pyrinomonadaceae bacterium]|jgi:hypothetical protein|nr:FG-GAP-like repeat-containing protein [Pyrinomonadaceae bacterium]
MSLATTRRRARALISTFIIALAASLCAASALAQSPTFGRTDYPLLGNNHVAADFNGDGRLDLAGSGAQSAAIMLGNGDGTFRAKVDYPVASWAQDIAAGDFNGDGKTDVVVTINDTQTGLSLLTGNGDGTFNAPVNFPNTSASDSPSVVATDLDNDGRLDVVIAHQLSCFTSPCAAARTISVMLGLGDGTFQPAREIEVGTGMSRIAVGDFNRDGVKDLGIAGDSAQLYVLFGVGDGTFAQQPTIKLVNENTLGVDGTDIDVADLNGDTVQDLVVAIALNGSRTAILIGNGDGTFRTPSIITEPNIRVPQYQAVADFNGDGVQDLALSLGWGLQGWMEILNGNGDGTFQQPVLYLAPDPKSSTSGGTLIAADFNGDGKPDIALQVAGASPALVALRNSTGVASAPLAYGAFAATPSSVVGGTSATVKLSLAPGAVAPAGGLQFKVSSSSNNVTVPSSVLMPAGSSSVAFTANTGRVTAAQSVKIKVTNSQLGSRTTSLSVTPPAGGNPPPAGAPTLSAVTLNPTSVAGGNAAQGTVTLSAPASAATVVSLASGGAAASVPASVTVASGASSASFAVSTAAVSSTTSVTISATLGGVTRTSTLTVNAPAPPPSADTVAITRAEYESAKRSLRVEATSTRSTATLQVFVTSTGQLIGTLTNSGGGKYAGQFSVSSNPGSITVKSSLGGSATRALAVK